MIQKPPDYDPTELYNIDEEDEAIDNPDVVERYKQSSKVARRCLELVIEKCKPGVSVQELCKYGDSMILNLCKDVVTEGDKFGIAMPTCVNPGVIVCNFSPGNIHDVEKNAVVKKGDDVRIDLGVHIEGYISVVGTNVFLPRKTTPQTLKKSIPTDDDRTRTICAAKRIMDLTMRMMKPGMGNYEIGVLSKKLCEYYNVDFLRGVLTHDISRYAIYGNKAILHRPTEDVQIFDEGFKMHEVYVLDIAVSSNRKNLGRTREKDVRPCLFRREPNEYKMFMKRESSQAVLDHIDKNFDNFYFPMRKVSEIKGNLGFVELKQKGLVSALPVLYGRQNECIVRLIATVAVTDEEIVPFCVPPMQNSFTKDELNLKDQKIINILKTTLKHESRVKEEKVKNKMNFGIE